MATTSETDSEGTVWTVTTSDGEAKIKRQHEWPHYLVACRGGMWIVEGSDFGRAHDAALAAIRATRGEAQPEGDGWEELRHNVWWWTFGEHNGSALMTGRGDWAWSLLRFGAPPAQGICETLDEAKRAVMDAARQSDDGRICPQCGTRYHKGIAHEQRCEAQPEPQHAVGEWWQVDDDRWSSKAGEWEFAVLRVDAERGEDGALHGGRWAWDALCLARNVEHEGECATRDEAMAAAEAAARGERTTTEWRQIDGGHWVREVGGLRVEVTRRLGGTWWSVTALLSRCGHADVCVVTEGVPAGDVGGAREEADEWLRARGVL